VRVCGWACVALVDCRRGCLIFAGVCLDGGELLGLVSKDLAVMS
jgi:hypothetical protein